MAIIVVGPGPTTATDLRSYPGSIIGQDYNTNDSIFFAWNTTSMTVAVHGGNDTVTTGFGRDIVFDNPRTQGPGFNAMSSRSSGNDVIRTNAGNDTIFAGDGRNSYDGGGDIDTINYSRANVGVTIDLQSGTGQGFGTDTLIAIENAVGSENNDFIIGSSIGNLLSGGRGDDDMSGNGGVDYIFGGEGRDVIEGGAGADSMNGGSEVDTLSYSTSEAGVTVNLATGVGQGGHAQGDGFVGFENLTGSRFDDKLTGNGADNILTGGAGRDILTGGTGNDTFRFTGRHSLTDSSVNAPDIITDFVRGKDLIDVRFINRAYALADDPMALVEGFTGAGDEMTVTMQAGSTMILGDRDGDKIADFAIQLTGAMQLTTSDFIL